MKENVLLLGNFFVRLRMRLSPDISIHILKHSSNHTWGAMMTATTANANLASRCVHSSSSRHPHARGLMMKNTANPKESQLEKLSGTARTISSSWLSVVASSE